MDSIGPIIGGPVSAYRTAFVAQAVPHSVAETRRRCSGLYEVHCTFTDRQSFSLEAPVTGAGASVFIRPQFTGARRPPHDRTLRFTTAPTIGARHRG